MVKKVAIVGCGSSGLSAIKACLEEELEPICFELTNDVGGLWKYREEEIDGVASVMRGTYMNTSKEMSAFSDFPPPDEYPNYLPHKLVHKYLSSYAEHFGLSNYVRFRHRVLEITPHKDYDESGQWEVKVTDEAKNETRTEVFDAVMICAGHHAYPHTPNIPGLNNFKGTQIHSHSYRKPEPFVGTKALVVGLGNSGADIAVELSRLSDEVYLSSRHGSWIHNRLGKFGKPYDVQFYRRKDLYMKGFSSLNRIFDKAEAELNFKVDHEFYGLKPQRRIYNQYTVINDEIAPRIINGSIKVKRDIDHFTENGVVFKDDSKVYEINLVVIATGYKLYYPFLREEFVDFEKDNLEIYRFVFPINLKHPSTLSFVGLIDPEGSVFTVSEMQSRWIARILSNKIRLTTRDSMEFNVNRYGYLLRKWSYEGNRHKTRIFWFFYMERLASYLGVKPDMTRLLFSDPRLFWGVFAGPIMAYQYRVQGPHAWSGARDAILNYQERIDIPMIVEPGRGGKVTSQAAHKSNFAQAGIKKVVFTCVLTLGVCSAYFMALA